MPVKKLRTKAARKSPPQLKPPRRKSRVPDWYVSTLMLHNALNAIVRAVGKLDRQHDIPYLAGYSRDGKTIFIDRHMPKSFTFKGRRIATDRFLILHEEVEKTLIAQLGLHYLHAHQIATRAEQAAVRAAGVSWHAYDAFMQKYVKRIGSEKLIDVPANLDTTPYTDEHDMELLDKMLLAIEDGAPPKSVAPRKSKQAVTRVLKTK